MSHSTFFKIETISKALFLFFFILGPLYIFSMVIYPLIVSHGDLKYLHSVWMDWQSLNVGVLAFLSSIIALYITRYHEIKQTQREFVAARSFLPEALSDLLGYLRTTSELLIEVWEQLPNEHKSPLTRPKPELPENYRATFSRCISLAEPGVSKHLSHILMLLQVHHARINELINSFQPDSRINMDKDNLKSYFYCLAEIYSLISQIFTFARGLEDEFYSTEVSFSDFYAVYNLLDIRRLSEFEIIEQFTRRNIAEKN